ncbi:MAG: ATP-binding protein [Thermoanaerobaculia bacterium]|jgi:ATP-dependent DNA helicase RecG|nr:ATP-binding protein [Thermoanaerobaculia bacterium]
MKESQHTEWKESWRDEYMRWVCGFANAEGGVLAIGRNDQGRVVGVPDAKRLLVELPNKVRDLLGIVVAVNLRRTGGKEYLEIVTPAYPAPISYRGHYYQRSGSTLQELKGAALDRFLLRKQGRTWDGVPMPGLSPRDLSTAAIQRFRSLARQSGRVEPGILREAVPSLLEKLKLRDDAYLKRAAALLFHEDPERFVSGAFVKIGFFRSETDLAFHDEVRGDLFTQVATTVDLLRTKYLEAGIRYEGIQRVERFGVPEAALREAVLNALIHRDYAIPAPVQIRVYADRLTIWNPAVLPEGWGLAELLGEHASLPYNPNVANAFFRAGQIEAWGRGIQRIFEACRAAGAPEPRLEASGHELRLELGFAGGPVAQAGEAPVKTPVKTRVKTPVKTADAILALLRERPDLRLADVAEALGKSTSAVERATRKLREEGRVRYVGPQKGGRWEVLT